MWRWLTKVGCQLGFGWNCAPREIVTLPSWVFSIHVHVDHKALLVYLDARRGVATAKIGYTRGTLS